MRDHWPNHPEWSQREGEAIAAAERRTTRRLAIGLAALSAVALFAVLL
ncbi:hypothetical protein [Qipengyuania sp.]